MFYVVELKKSLDIHPRYFGPRLVDIIEERLRSEVEGTCSGKSGFIIAVTSVKISDKGLIRMDGTGLATFPITFSCLVMRPFKGEVIDCIVTSVNKMGFFAEAGPLQTFVSNHLIPEDFEYNASGDAAYVAADESIRIQEGTEVRLRIVGHRMEASEIFCIGTIKDDYLGVISNPVGV